MSSSAGQTPVVDESSDESDADAGLTRDQVYDILSSRRRRFVLHALARDSDAVPVGELAARIAAWENDHDSVAAVEPAERKRVYTALHQLHLTRLDDAGIVDYSPGEGVVGTTDRTAAVRRYLWESTASSYHRHCLLTTLLGLGVVVASLLKIAMVGPAMAAAGAMGVGLVSLSLYRLRETTPEARDRAAAIADGATPEVVESRSARRR